MLRCWIWKTYPFLTQTYRESIDAVCFISFNVRYILYKSKLRFYIRYTYWTKKLNVGKKHMFRVTKGLYLGQCHTQRVEDHEYNIENQWSWKDNWPLQHKSLDICYTWISNKKNIGLPLIFLILLNSTWKIIREYRTPRTVWQKYVNNIEDGLRWYRLTYI